MIKGCPTNHLQNAENFRFMNPHSQFRWARIFTTTICDICFCIFPGIFSRTDMAGGIWLGLQTVTICVEKKHWFSEQGWILRGLREETSATRTFWKSFTGDIPLGVGRRVPPRAQRSVIFSAVAPGACGTTARNGRFWRACGTNTSTPDLMHTKWLRIYQYLLGSSHCRAEVSDLERFAGCFAGAFWLDHVSFSLRFFTLKTLWTLTNEFSQVRNRTEFNVLVAQDNVWGKPKTKEVDFEI